jgi:hypothetical protein
MLRPPVIAKFACPSCPHPPLLSPPPRLLAGNVIVGNGKLCDRWGLRWLVRFVALGGERRKFLLHGVLVCDELIDRGSD